MTAIFQYCEKTPVESDQFTILVITLMRRVVGIVS